VAGVNGVAVPRSPASYVHRATARAARRDVMCRAGGDPLQVVLCGRQRGQVAWLCGARVLVARRGGRHAGAVACAGARVVARARGRAEAVWSGRAHARGRCGAGAQACGRGAAWPSRRRGADRWRGVVGAVVSPGVARPGAPRRGGRVPTHACARLAWRGCVCREWGGGARAGAGSWAVASCAMRRLVRALRLQGGRARGGGGRSGRACCVHAQRRSRGGAGELVRACAAGARRAQERGPRGRRARVEGVAGWSRRQRGPGQVRSAAKKGRREERRRKEKKKKKKEKWGREKREGK